METCVSLSYQEENIISHASQSHPIFLDADGNSELVKEPFPVSKLAPFIHRVLDFVEKPVRQMNGDFRSFIDKLGRRPYSSKR